MTGIRKKGFVLFCFVSGTLTRGGKGMKKGHKGCLGSTPSTKTHRKSQIRWTELFNGDASIPFHPPTKKNHKTQCIYYTELTREAGYCIELKKETESLHTGKGGDRDIYIADQISVGAVCRGAAIRH